MTPAMNDTKWNELRLAMDAMELTPALSTFATNGYQAPPDRDWYYHLRDREDGFSYILHIDIHAEGLTQRELIRAALREVHVPGEETAGGFRVFGYILEGQSVDYL